MSTTTATPAVDPATVDRTAARRTALVVGLVVLAVTATLSIVDGNSDGERVVDVGAQLVAFVLLYLVAVPRVLVSRRAGAAAVVLGVLAALLVFPAFWSGLPLQLGVAAALMGAAGRRGPRPAPALVALVCGLLAGLGYAAVYVVDALTH